MLTFICIFLCIYLTPSAIALINRHPHRSQIFITNLLLGWSIVFWVFAFRMAMGWDKVLKTPEKP
ncbi:MAG: superinfection immunity protein [Desulfobacteraceae bacterium]|nr:superinfection immunity protein [Desulfobacteraceae bacterium]